MISSLYNMYKMRLQFMYYIILIYYYVRSNLLIPNGFKMAPTHLARYSLNLYKSEIMSHVFNGGTTLIMSIGFGEALEVFDYLYNQTIK